MACTGSPRRMPSVASIAMQRTTLSPMSDATSRTISRPSSRDLQGLEQLRLVAGVELDVDDGADHLADPSFARRLSCSASALGLAFVFCHQSSSLIPQLAASAPLTISISSVVMSGLADLVRVQGQRIDQVAGGVGRVLHRDHLGRVLARLVLEHRLEDLRLHVARQQPIQHRLRLRLVDVVGPRILLRRLRACGISAGIRTRIVGSCRMVEIHFA